MLFELEQVFKVCWLLMNDWLELKIDPFTKRLWEAVAVGADGAGGQWLFVEFDERVKISEGVLAIFLDMFANVGDWVVV